MAGKTGRSGGRRTGAGRKKKLEKYQSQIEAAEFDIADRLPELLGNLYHLANGGYEKEEYEYQAAGTFTHQVKDEASGQIMEVLTFPGKKADEMVLVRKKKWIADVDKGANSYLVDRVMGRPKQRQEITGAEGGGVQITVRHVEHARKD